MISCGLDGSKHNYHRLRRSVIRRWKLSDTGDKKPSDFFDAVIFCSCYNTTGSAIDDWKNPNVRRRRAVYTYSVHGIRSNADCVIIIITSRTLCRWIVSVFLLLLTIERCSYGDSLRKKKEKKKANLRKIVIT